MISAIVQATKPADAPPLIDLAARAALPLADAGLLWRRRMLLMRIERATTEDAAAVEALLREAQLPLDGAAEALSLGVVARDGRRRRRRGRRRALRRRGAAALGAWSRRDRRGTGLGREIVAAAEDLARADGVRDLYLLTETAIDWFPRLGYEVVDRPVATAAVGESVEFTTVCKDTGVPMRRRLA